VAAGERGAVAVIVAAMLVALLGMAALAIDLSSFYQAQRQAQTAADAGALAGAEDLARSSTTAGGDATTLARQNFPGATVTANADTTSNQVTVTVTAPTPVFFGKLLGLSSETVGARAVAGPNAGNSCRNPAAGSSACDAIFARDTSCGTSPAPITISGGGMNLSGGIWSDGSVSQSGGNATFSGPLTVGTGTGCAWNGATGGSTAPVSDPPTNWPIDYGLDFPSPTCTTTCTTVTGVSGVPNFCTQASTAASWSVTPVSNNIYCAVGTGTPADPRTWNGALTVKVVGGTVAASYFGGTVTVPFSSNPTLEPCGYAASGYTASNCNATVPNPTLTSNYPLVYAVGTGSSATLSGGQGGGTIIGDVFAPNGLLTFGGGGATSIGFLQGLDVSVSGGGLSGDGPLANSSGGFTPTVSLLQ
jgi:Putative Flp pilus-assembly TadE/G-like